MNTYQLHRLDAKYGIMFQHSQAQAMLGSVANCKALINLKYMRKTPNNTYTITVLGQMHSLFVELIELMDTRYIYRLLLTSSSKWDVYRGESRYGEDALCEYTQVRATKETMIKYITNAITVITSYDHIPKNYSEQQTKFVKLMLKGLPK